MTACEEMGMLWKFIRGCQLCHVPKPRRTWLKSSLFAFHSMHRAGIGASTWQWALHQAHWHQGALLCCCLTQGFQPAFPFLIESIAFSLDVFHGDKNPERLLLLPRCPQASFVSQLCCFMKASYLWTWDPTAQLEGLEGTLPQKSLGILIWKPMFILFASYFVTFAPQIWDVAR